MAQKLLWLEKIVPKVPADSSLSRNLKDLLMPLLPMLHHFAGV